MMADSLAEAVGRLLGEKQETLAVAEATTGGLISARIVSVPGSSAYYVCGMIPYSRASKVELLGIDASALDSFGAVSAEAAIAMAQGVRTVSGATLGLAETGIAGPIRGRSTKPIGTAFLAVAAADQTHCETYQFLGDRDAVRNAISDAALQMILDVLWRSEN